MVPIIFDGPPTTITMTSIMCTTQANDADDPDFSCTGSIWSNAVKWIITNGGYVHPQLRYNDSERQVYCDPSSPIDAGTLLIQITDKCLPSLHSVEKDDELGKALFRVVHSLDSSLYHEAQDVVLALFLAHQQRKQASFYEPYLCTLPMSNIPSTNGENESSSHNNVQLLPRQWDDETLKLRLGGSSLYNRIVKEKDGIKNEYNLIKAAWMRLKQQQNGKTNDDIDSESSFPTFEQYDNMMAQVTSRGFEGLGFDKVDVMIPLLDLLNHVRGKGNNDAPAGDVAHVRYERYDETNNDVGGGGEPATKRIKASIDESTTATNNLMSSDVSSGGVKVTAGQSIVAKGTKLQMTYGAKSNATLLGRYGFCIDNNEEPDGSNNDVIEVELKEGSPPVKLQRGPKSYTYGLFVKALELFHDADAGNDGRSDGDDDNVAIHQHLQAENTNKDARRCDEDDRESDVDEDDGGLQAFLDDCEEDDDDPEDDEEEGDDDLDHMMYHSTSFGDDGQLLDNSLPPSTKTENELRALEALQSSLKQAMERCEQNSLLSSSKESISSSAEDKYCMILIKSEIETLCFYKQAAEVIHSMLSKSFPRVDSLSAGDQEQHVHDLARAFVTIRYPGLAM